MWMLTLFQEPFCCRVQCDLMSEANPIIKYAMSERSNVEHVPRGATSSSSNLRHRWCHFWNRCCVNVLHFTLDYVANVFYNSPDNQLPYVRSSIRWGLPEENIHWRRSRVRLPSNAIGREYAYSVHHVQPSSVRNVTASQPEGNRRPLRRKRPTII